MVSDCLKHLNYLIQRVNDMNYFTNKKLVTLAVILLVIINLSALTTIILQKHAPGKGHQPRQKDAIETTTHFLKTELQFSDEQVEGFILLQDKFLEENKILTQSIGELKHELYSSLFVEGSDLTLNTAIIEQIGKQTMLLEKSSYAYFQTIKDLCTEEQKESFDKLLGQILLKVNPQHQPPHDRKGPPPPLHGEKPGERPLPPPKRK